ncbi:MAG: cytochrome c3 family protein [Nitrospinota bacterium]|nr:cytochrome c3 family protein [Nitrospinota bacterium]
MRLFLSIAAVAVVIAFAFAGYKASNGAIFMNEDLSANHEAAEEDCDVCHDAWGGVPVSSCENCHDKKVHIIRANKCTACHADEKPLWHVKINSECWGCHNRFDWATGPQVPEWAKELKHASGDIPHQGKRDCYSCHEEHKGRHRDIRKIEDNKCKRCHLHKNHPPARPVYPKKGDQNPLNFSHKIHFEKTTLDSKNCDFCHTRRMPDGKVMLTASFRKHCGTSCHELPDHKRNAKDTSKCKLCHTRDDYSIVPKLTLPKINLVHAPERHAKFECLECHTNVINIESGVFVKKVEVSICTTCHKLKKMNSNCTTCHQFHNHEKIESETIANY